MKGGKRDGAGRRKQPEHLRRVPVTIRLPNWMIAQLKEKGQIGYMVEVELATKDGLLELPSDYVIGS